MELVTLAQASDHLRRDTNADDADLRLKIRAASQAVADALGSRFAEIVDTSGLVPVDSSGEPIVPENVQQATLLLLGDMYSNRGESEQTNWAPDRLPTAVWALLNPRRTPVLR